MSWPSDVHQKAGHACQRNQVLGQCRGWEGWLTLQLGHWAVLWLKVRGTVAGEVQGAKDTHAMWGRERTSLGEGHGELRLQSWTTELPRAPAPTEESGWSLGLSSVEGCWGVASSLKAETCSKKLYTILSAHLWNGLIGKTTFRNLPLSLLSFFSLNNFMEV